MAAACAEGRGGGRDEAATSHHPLPQAATPCRRSSASSPSLHGWEAYLPSRPACPHFCYIPYLLHVSIQSAPFWATKIGCPLSSHGSRTLPPPRTPSLPHPPTPSHDGSCIPLPPHTPSLLLPTLSWYAATRWIATAPPRDRPNTITRLASTSSRCGGEGKGQGKGKGQNVGGGTPGQLWVGRDEGAQQTAGGGGAHDLGLLHLASVLLDRPPPPYTQ